MFPDGMLPTGMFPGTLTVPATLGIVGVALYVSAYALLQAGVLRGASYAYASLNLVGASLVLVSLLTEWNLASALIQIAWVLISIAGITRIFLINHRIRFDDEERGLADDVLPDMPPPLVRRLLDRGIWMDAPVGLVLTVEGAPVDRLHYLADGAAEVDAGGQVVATIRRGLVGEMNVLEAGPASATVRVTAPGRVFTIPGATLRRLVAADAEFRLHLEQRLHAATRRKLIEANRRAGQNRSAE